MDDLIQRAREALVDVTPGPWKAVAAGQAADLNEVVRREPFQSIADVEGADARFIAAARDLVPALTDRLAAQEALLKEAMCGLSVLLHVYDGVPMNPIEAERRATDARATLAKLRAHLEGKP